MRVGTHGIEKADIDGWRLDVADEVDAGFWRDFRRGVRPVKPDVLLLMETWQDAQPWLSGDQLDSAVNDPLQRAVSRFFGKCSTDAESFDREIWRLLTRSHRAVQEIRSSSLDGSGVPRFLCGANGDLRRLRLASVFLFTHVGIPVLDQRDELGVAGVAGRELGDAHDRPRQRRHGAPGRPDRRRPPRGPRAAGRGRARGSVRRGASSCCRCPRRPSRRNRAEGEREGAAWRVLLAELLSTSNGHATRTDLGFALPFLLAAGRSDAVPRFAASAAAAGQVPAWLVSSAGADGSEVAVLGAALAGTGDTTVCTSCADGGAGAGGSF